MIFFLFQKGARAVPYLTADETKTQYAVKV